MTHLGWVVVWVSLLAVESSSEPPHQYRSFYYHHPNQHHPPPLYPVQDASPPTKQPPLKSTFNLAQSKKTTTSGEPCKPDHLTVYKVVLATHWSRDKFPKQYPEFRPHAQWSKMVGRSHNASYILWRLGETASAGVKILAENGKSDVLDAESQGEGGIYDEFSAPPINAGVGRTEAEFFVDGNHSRVSLISRIIPSPDWFVGVDSLNLCVQGNWIDTVTIDAGPIDAGTDQGFTFTAPNWASDPQEPIYKIMAHYPDHPANGFYYPKLKQLPTLATFKFIKVKEYELSQIFYHDEDSDTKRVDEETSELDNMINVMHDDPPRSSARPPEPVTEFVPYSKVPQRRDDSNDEPSGVKAPPAIINKIIETYNLKPSAVATKNRKQTKRNRGPRHCRVSEWSEWSPCSKSCGIGESKRTRSIVKHARRGGRICPPLVESKWCGSARACNKEGLTTYFNW